MKQNMAALMRPKHLPPSAWTGHIPFAGWIVAEHKPRIFVELGTHNGTSYLAFCQAVVECGLMTKCHAVDTWEGDVQAGIYGDDVLSRLQEVHDRHYAGFSQLMKMRFDDALPYFEDGSIDLLHIDGLHTYEAVKHDFESWLPKMSRRGVVLFHDTMVRERDFGVWMLWRELSERYPSFELSHAHGLGILAVGDDLSPSVMDMVGLGKQRDEDAALALRFFETLGDRAILLSSEQKLGQSMEEIKWSYHVLAEKLAATEAGLADAMGQLGRADAYAKVQVAQAEDLNQKVVRLSEENDSLRKGLMSCASEYSALAALIESGNSNMDSLASRISAIDVGLDRLADSQGRILQVEGEAVNRLSAVEASVEQVVGIQDRILQAEEARARVSGMSWWRSLRGSMGGRPVE